MILKLLRLLKSNILIYFMNLTLLFDFIYFYSNLAVAGVLYISLGPYEPPYFIVDAMFESLFLPRLVGEVHEGYH